jgi:hypothetical protein
MNATGAPISEQQSQIARSHALTADDTVQETVAERADVAAGRGWERAFFIAVCALVVVLVCGPLVIRPRLANDHYVYLSHNLVQGKLSVDDLPSVYPDPIKWQGHKYLPLGPLPAVLLVPFLPLFDLGLRLVWVSHLFTLFNAWLFYRVLGLAGVTGERRQWALLLFFGGTVYFSLALVGASYFFAHIVTVTFLLLALWEALGRRRPWLVGLFLGLAGMARMTALFALPAFAWLLWRDSRQADEDHAVVEDRGGRALASSAVLLIGAAGPVLLLFAYNYLRFGNPLESGYSMAILGNPVLTEARAQGLFSLVHVPKNLFMMLLQGPLPWPDEDAPVLTFPFVWPSPWGMGLVYTSPALIYAFRARFKEPLVQACWLGVLCVMLPIITYYGVGWIQFGYRYALDFLPFLLLLAARGFPSPLTNVARLLVLASVVVNIWGSIFLILWI